MASVCAIQAWRSIEVATIEGDTRLPRMRSSASMPSAGSMPSRNTARALAAACCGGAAVTDPLQVGPAPAEIEELLLHQAIQDLLSLAAAPANLLDVELPRRGHVDVPGRAGDVGHDLSPGGAGDDELRGGAVEREAELPCLSDRDGERGEEEDVAELDGARPRCSGGRLFEGSARELQIPGPREHRLGSAA